MEMNLYQPIVGFRSRKAAQMAAHFACLSGGTIEKLKLIKIIYLAERECISRHARPMLFDEFYSLPQGPICSATLNGIDGRLDGNVWDSYIARNGNIVVAVRAIGRQDLDEVSDAEFDVLSKAWQMFGPMTASTVRNFTHTPGNCPEYTEVPLGTRLPITYEKIFAAVGIENAAEVAAEIDEFRRIESALAGTE
jgi:uncharacterized phage-associated protein